MIYPIELKTVGLVLGLVLIATHAFALWKEKSLPAWLKAFPRSRAAGTVLIALAGIWSFLLISQMDLGEFARLRNIMLGAIVIGSFLAWRYMEEFLAVRALGMLALLAAEPLLSAAFLRPEMTRLLVVFLAYAWILLGLFWVGMPWILRDQITWLTAVPGRLKLAACGGLAYGLLILACVLVLWK